jgi:hypothetical protein
MTKADLSTMTAASAESRFNLIIIRKHEHFGMGLKSIEVINSQVTQRIGGKFSWRTTSTTMMAQNFYRGHLNILYPELDWGGPGSNYEGREFQSVT